MGLACWHLSSMLLASSTLPCNRDLQAAVDQQQQPCDAVVLAKHVKCCQVTDCALCKYATHGESWKRSCPLIASTDSASVDRELFQDLSPSWLTAKLALNGDWGIGCWVCAKAGCQSAMGRFAVGNRNGSAASVHVSNLSRHSGSGGHKAAVIKLLRERGLAVSDKGLVDALAPTVESFLATLEHARSGGAIENSAARRCPSGRKFKQMAWCLSVVIWDRDRLALKNAEVVGLFRDERAGHLLVRFVAIGSDLVMRHGMLGLRCHFGTGSVNLTHATSLIIERAASRMWAKPHREASPEEQPIPDHQFDLPPRPQQMWTKGWWDRSGTRLAWWQSTPPLMSSCLRKECL